ncbi:MAG: SAM-dependent chlorinase/fluorinase, partial [Bacteroidetes bacterium]|nr:SAM-dependent chlorinase/fluorinase [Bacteroidota bacterium]
RTIITLTSDWGTADFYAGSMKGKLLSLTPKVVITDITHDVPKFDFFKASFIIRNAFADFPEGTIHIVAVNNQDSTRNTCLIIHHSSHYFIGPDNGLFSLVFDETPTEIFRFKTTPELSATAMRTVYAEAAARLVNGENPAAFAEIEKSWTEKVPYRAVPEGNQIKGNIIYIDSYQNLITNITQEAFYKHLNNRKFRICLKRESYDIETISASYNAVVPGERLALFNNAGLLEIAINLGSAASLLGMKIKEVIRVEFFE